MYVHKHAYRHIDMNANIYIHLGGAIATLMAIELYKNNITNIKVYSYGSPRIFNKESAIYISKLLPERTVVRTTHYKGIYFFIFNLFCSDLLSFISLSSMIFFCTSAFLAGSYEE
jgi:hypothetical protein